MNKQIAAQRAYLKRENRTWPATLVLVQEAFWPDNRDPRCVVRAVLRSSEFLVQVVEETDKRRLRLSINRTMISNNGQWLADISWEELQRLKAEAGFADYTFIEIFPAERHVVNVANMRHLWLFPEAETVAWTREARA